MAKFRPGQSGNPQGRPRGTSKAAKLRKAIEGDLPAIIKAMAEAAKEGDTAAAKLLMDRTVPPIRARDEPVGVPGMKSGADLADQGAAVLAALGAGKLAPTEASALMGAIAVQTRVVESTDLAKRIFELEEKVDGKSEAKS